MVPFPGDDVYFPISSMAHAKAPAAPAPTTATPAAQSTAAQGKDCGSTGLVRMVGMLVLELEKICLGCPPVPASFKEQAKSDTVLVENGYLYPCEVEDCRNK